MASGRWLIFDVILILAWFFWAGLTSDTSTWNGTFLASLFFSFIAWAVDRSRAKKRWHWWSCLRFGFSLTTAAVVVFFLVFLSGMPAPVSTQAQTTPAPVVQQPAVQPVPVEKTPEPPEEKRPANLPPWAEELSRYPKREPKSPFTASAMADLPEEYTFACSEIDRSKCSKTITHLKYLPDKDVLMESVAQPGWSVPCPLVPTGLLSHWKGECTYEQTLAIGRKDGKSYNLDKPVVCTVTTSEEITYFTKDGDVLGLSGKIDWSPTKFDNGDWPTGICFKDSGEVKEFHLVPVKQQ